MATVTLEPDATNEGIKVQADGRVYLGKKLQGRRVNVYAELVEEDADA